MNLTKEEYVERLIEISKNKLHLINQIYFSTPMSDGRVSYDNTQMINQYFENKQKIIVDINNLDDAFEVYYIKLKSLLNDENKLECVQDSRILKSLVEEIVDMTGKVQDIENQFNSNCSELMNDIKRNISAVNRSSIVNNSYLKKSNETNTSRFLDEKK